MQVVHLTQGAGSRRQKNGQQMNKLNCFSHFLHAYLNKGAVFANAFSLIIFSRRYSATVHTNLVLTSQYIRYFLWIEIPHIKRSFLVPVLHRYRGSMHNIFNFMVYINLFSLCIIQLQQCCAYSHVIAEK